ncbi:MAG: tRNA (adenosine(37)-N6)-dimethylallyltransferase MiaA [Pseudomonadales bacterium]|nr:tRNA (adenosine(37)-N6)-dimethylallyltransferase MiaA [Pseudomonadales bacterium]
MLPTTLTDPDSVLIICGPTAIGKTAVAMAVQDALGGKAHAQLISADSALIYRGMDIGTAKPTHQEQQAYPHALIDIRDANESYSAADFVRDVDAELARAVAAGKKPIVVGGTMMYLKCLLQGIADLPQTDIVLREALEQELAERGAQSLHDDLAQYDLEAAAGIHPNNHQRLLRALAVVRTTGQSISAQWRSNDIGTLFDRTGLRHKSVVMLPQRRETLHQHIAQRFKQMLAAGFLDEVRSLMNRGDLTREMPSMRAVGYRQAWAHLVGETDQADFSAQATAATRQLAKRQMTWLRKWPNTLKVVSDTPSQTVDAVLGR